MFVIQNNNHEKVQSIYGPLRELILSTHTLMTIKSIKARSGANQSAIVVTLKELIDAKKVERITNKQGKIFYKRIGG